MPLVNKRILAIDDTPSIRTFLRISLEGHSANYHEAATAEEGVRLSEELKPDLVVLDLGLPDRDGLDILPEIKKKATNGHVPKIVILTVRKEQRIIEKAYALGADAYVTKPFLMEDLMDVIRRELE